MGLNPDETTSAQTVNGVTYKLDNTGRGTRYLSQVGTGSTSSSSTNISGITNSLNERYDKLISSLKDQGETASQKAIATTSSELGKRGIMGSSTIAQKEIQNASELARQPYTSAATQADVDRSNALLGAQMSIANLQEGARQFDTTTALKQAELAMGGGNKYQVVGSEGGYVIDPNTGDIVKTLAKITGGTGGSGVSSYYNDSTNQYMTPSSRYTLIQ